MPKDQLYTVVKPNGEHFTLDDIASLEDELRERDLELDDVLVFASAPLKLKRSLTIVDDEPKKPRKPRTPKSPAVETVTADDTPVRYNKDGSLRQKPGRKPKPANGHLIMNEDLEEV